LAFKFQIFIIYSLILSHLGAVNNEFCLWFLLHALVLTSALEVRRWGSAFQIHCL